MSAQQSELPFGSAPIKGTRNEPRLWVREFAFYSDYKPESLVRRITLRRGLNIIWAKESETGASGHAAGKSTFCRMLRYLIGDSTFGTENFRPALRAKFPAAIIAGEIVLDGEPWLVCRSLQESGYHWCAKGYRLEDLFKSDTSKTDYKEFVTQLHEVFVSPLKLEHYPSTEKAIEWQHLLQWLSRDQDARYSGTLHWRPSGEGAYLQSSQKTNLIRLVLGALSEAEVKKQREHGKHLTDRNEIKELLPKLRFARDRSVSDLAEEFQGLKGDGIDLESKLEELLTETRKKHRKKEAELRKANREDGINPVIAQTCKLRKEERDAVQARLTALKSELRRARLRHSYRTEKLSREEFDQQISEIGDIKGKCSALISVAIEMECPLAPSANRDELSRKRYEDALETVEEIERLIDKLKTKKENIREELANAEKAISPLEEKVKEQSEAQSNLRDQLVEEVTDLDELETNLEKAFEDTKKIREKREEQTELDSKIEKSSKDLEAFRKKGRKVLSILADDLSHVASHVTQVETRASVEFHSEAVVTSLNYAGDMSSAALVTLRLLIFDLACLLGSVREESHHPGLLIHDSPREADLSAHLYRRLFSMVAGTEGGVENEAVQYIVATTEPPPEFLQKEPWLVCEPLSSETAEGRFLKAIV